MVEGSSAFFFLGFGFLVTPSSSNEERGEGIGLEDDEAATFEEEASVDELIWVEDELICVEDEVSVTDMESRSWSNGAVDAFEMSAGEPGRLEKEAPGAVRKDLSMGFNPNTIVLMLSPEPSA